MCLSLRIYIIRSNIDGKQQKVERDGAKEESEEDMTRVQSIARNKM